MQVTTFSTPTATDILEQVNISNFVDAPPTDMSVSAHVFLRRYTVKGALLYKGCNYSKTDTRSLHDAFSNYYSPGPQFLFLPTRRSLHYKWGLYAYKQSFVTVNK
jgi:hypothetical protein